MTSPVPQPRQRRKVQLQPKEEMINDILLHLSTANGILRRQYDCDGRREETPAEVGSPRNLTSRQSGVRLLTCRYVAFAANKKKVYLMA